MAEIERPENIVKAILKERGIQQKFICDKTGIPPQILHAW